MSDWDTSNKSPYVASLPSHPSLAEFMTGTEARCQARQSYLRHQRRRSRSPSRPLALGCVVLALRTDRITNNLAPEPQPVIHYRLGGPGLFIDSQPSAGLLSLQRKILNSASELVWVDTIADSRWTLLSTRGSPLDVLSSTSKKLLEKMGGTSIDLKGRDATGAYAKWFEEECGGAEVVLIRPDFYVAFGCKFSDLEETFGAFAAGVGLV